MAAGLRRVRPRGVGVGPLGPALPRHVGLREQGLWGWAGHRAAAGAAEGHTAGGAAVEALPVGRAGCGGGRMWASPQSPCGAGWWGTRPPEGVGPLPLVCHAGAAQAACAGRVAAASTRACVGQVKRDRLDQRHRARETIFCSSTLAFSMPQTSSKMPQAAPGDEQRQSSTHPCRTAP